MMNPLSISRVIDGCMRSSMSTLRHSIWLGVTRYDRKIVKTTDSPSLMIFLTGDRNGKGPAQHKDRPARRGGDVTWSLSLADGDPPRGRIPGGQWNSCGRPQSRRRNAGV